MISGQDDGSTPPLLASNALKYLTHGRQVSIPNYGHQLDSPCVWSIMMQFIEAGTELKTSTPAVPPKYVARRSRPTWPSKVSGADGRG